MIQITVKSNGTRRTETAEVTSTPAEIFDNIGIDTSRSMVNLDGVVLNSEGQQRTFESLGVTDGSTVTLSSVVKADGAAD
jgi:hypothetical protein